jgi:hypothetical protein
LEIDITQCNGCPGSLECRLPLELIRESGNKDLAVAATNIAIWNDAVAKKLAFLPGEKAALPGDIVIFNRRGSEKIDELRSGKISYLPTGSGVVYSSDQDKFSSIEGNVGNAVRLRDHLLVDRIIGYPASGLGRVRCRRREPGAV